MDEKIEKTKPKRPKYGGRKKGVPNKTTRSIKQAIEKAFHNVERKGWLERQAWENPAVFAGLIAKIMPTELKASVEHTMQIDVSAAMALAEKRLEELHAKFESNIIDVTPDKECNEINTLTSPNNQADKSTIDLKPSKPLKDNET